MEAGYQAWHLQKSAELVTHTCQNKHEVSIRCARSMHLGDASETDSRTDHVIQNAWAAGKYWDLGTKYSRTQISLCPWEIWLRD